LYTYVFNDPLNRVDPSGNQDMAVARWFWNQVDAAEEIAEQERQKRPLGHNDPEDAMRHAEWSRRMAAEVNPVIAFLAGWQHEISGTLRGQPMSELFMDLNNNREGREAAADNRMVDPNNLVTSAEASDYDANRGTYFEDAAARLNAGGKVSLGNTTLSLNQAKGTLESKTEITGTRIVEKRQTCVDARKCTQ
jgi:hypothetical protein